MKGSPTIPGVTYAPLTEARLFEMYRFNDSARRVKRALPAAYRARIQIVVPRVIVWNAPPRLS